LTVSQFKIWWCCCCCCYW